MDCHSSRLISPPGPPAVSRSLDLRTADQLAATWPAMTRSQRGRVLTGIAAAFAHAIGLPADEVGEVLGHRAPGFVHDSARAFGPLLERAG